VALLLVWLGLALAPEPSTQAWSASFWVMWRAGTLFVFASTIFKFSPQRKDVLCRMSCLAALYFWFPRSLELTDLTQAISLVGVVMIVEGLHRKKEALRLSLLLSLTCLWLGLLVTNCWYTLSYPIAKVSRPLQTATHLAKVSEDISVALAGKSTFEQLLLDQSADWVSPMKSDVVSLSGDSHFRELENDSLFGEALRQPKPVSGEDRLTLLLLGECLKWSLIIVGGCFVTRIPRLKNPKPLKHQNFSVAAVGALLLSEAILVLPVVFDHARVSTELCYLLSFTPGFFAFWYFGTNLRVSLRWCGIRIVLFATAIDQLGTEVLVRVLEAFGLYFPWTDWASQVHLYAGSLNYLYQVLVSVVWAPFFEEFLFRGLLFGVFLRRFSFWPSAVLSSIIFAAFHLSSFPETLILIWGGLVLCWVYQRSGSLLPGILVHSIFNILVLIRLAAYR
jgi:membrane protease YdiL (CAAX protease family)